MRLPRRLAGRSAMGFVAAVIVIAEVVRVGAQAPPPQTADSLLNAAKVTAQEEQKNILVEFSASWCGWCRRFEAFLQSSDLGPLMSRHFVVVKFVVQESPDKRALNTPGGQNFMEE